MNLQEYNLPTDRDHDCANTLLYGQTVLNYVLFPSIETNSLISINKQFYLGPNGQILIKHELLIFYYNKILASHNIKTMK